RARRDHGARGLGGRDLRRLGDRTARGHRVGERGRRPHPRRGAAHRAAGHGVGGDERRPRRDRAGAPGLGGPSEPPRRVRRRGRGTPVSEAAAGRDLVALPRAAVLMLWTAAYLRGDLGPDDAAQMSYGVGRSGPSGQGEDLFTWMTSLRRLPLAQLRLVLPVPGRIAGLVGPPAAIGPALEAEQAIVVTAAGIADHTLIPVLTPVEHERRAVTAVTWQQVPAPVGAQVAPTASSGSAREELLHALRRTAGGSVDLDLVPEEPVEPARIPQGWISTALPRHLEPSAAHLLVLAARTLLLTRAEIEEGHGHTVHLAEALTRRGLLDELHDAARSALVETVERLVAAETG